MGIFADHHLIYAVILDTADISKINKFSTVIPKSVNVCSHGRKFYLEISVCDNDDLFATNYYKKNIDNWFDFKFCCEQVTRISDSIDDILMTPEQYENLQIILNSGLKEYILDHYWYDRVTISDTYDPDGM